MTNVRIPVGRATLELVTGDITRQEGFDAIVNAANAQLLPGGGVAGAIHRAAGPELAAAGAPHAPISPGQAVATEAFKLPNRYVIHCLGPVYGIDHPAAELLGSCYRNALILAERRGLESVAFPAISTGAFGYPLHDAAQVAVQTVVSVLPSLQAVKRVRFVLFDEHALEVHREALNALDVPPAA